MPSEFFVHIGMRCYFTKTLRRDIDFVNGMAGTIVGWCEASRSVRVETETGHKVEVWPYTDPDLGNLTFYPLREGYASTVNRMAGAELPHVTVYLDAPKVAAAAYTAISRVSSLDDLLLGGIVSADHFTPARM